jgi:hypothetical protein
MTPVIVPMVARLNSQSPASLGERNGERNLSTAFCSVLASKGIQRGLIQSQLNQADFLRQVQKSRVKFPARREEIATARCGNVSRD